MSRLPYAMSLTEAGKCTGASGTVHVSDDLGDDDIICCRNTTPKWTGVKYSQVTVNILFLLLRLVKMKACMFERVKLNFICNFFFLIPGNRKLSFPSGKMCFLWYWTKSFISCSPQEKKGGKGKGLFESKVLDLILQDSLIKRKKKSFWPRWAFCH